MTHQLNAGDFESKFADFLADALVAGQLFSLNLVEECYKKAATSLGLPSNRADELHIVDMHSSLSALGVLPIVSNANALRRKIFELTYIH